MVRLTDSVRLRTVRPSLDFRKRQVPPAVDMKEVPAGEALGGEVPAPVPVVVATVELPVAHDRSTCQTFVSFPREFAFLLATHSIVRLTFAITSFHTPSVGKI